MRCCDLLKICSVYRNKRNMPCHDPRDNPQFWEDEATEGYTKINKLSQSVEQLEAVMCAVFNELESLGLINQIIEAANVRSGYDAWALWNAHLSSDKERLKQKLKDTFSATEQRLIKEILNNE